MAFSENVGMAAHLLAVVCGGFVGFSLALTGGGGSILAVPLLLYVVGMKDAHLAIGTSALAVAVNAYANLIPHARAGHVRWRRSGLHRHRAVPGGPRRWAVRPGRARSGLATPPCPVVCGP